MQIAFAKAYRSWRRISRLESPEAYVRKMAVNEVLNARRTAHVATRGRPRRSARRARSRRRRTGPRRDVAGRPVPATAAARRPRPPLLRGPQRAADRRRARLPPRDGEVAGVRRAGDAPDPAGPADGGRRGALMNLEDTTRESPSRHGWTPWTSRPATSPAPGAAGHRMRVRRRVAAGVGAAVVVAAGVAGIARLRASAHRGARPVGPGTGASCRPPRCHPGPMRRVSGPAARYSCSGARPIRARPTRTAPRPARSSGTARRTTRPRTPGESIPPAPVPVGAGDRLVVADGVVVLGTRCPDRGSSWFTYEPDHNRWSRIDQRATGRGRPAVRDRASGYVPAGRRIAVYDVRRFEWSLLPPDPITPALTERTRDRDPCRSRLSRGTTRPSPTTARCRAR